MFNNNLKVLKNVLVDRFKDFESHDILKRCLSQRHNKKVKAIHCCSFILNNVGKANRQSCGKDDEAHFPANFSRARTALTKNAVCETPNVCGELVQKIVSFDTLENAASAAFVNT